jgi:peptidoglycan/LPS O-acetylase OafA/YrhL
VSAARPQPRRAERIDELDAFRAIACIAIVILHAYQDSRITSEFIYEDHPVLDAVLRNLDFGLAMFFVLSGFLIFRPFARAALAGEPCPSIGRFLQRRAWRLLPLYVLVIVVVWSLRYAGTADNWRDLLLHLTFAQPYSDAHIFSIDGPAWSLAVEWHYYVLVALLAPMICASCARVRSARARLWVVCAPAIALVLGSVAFKWWAQEIAGFDHQRDYAVYYSALARVDTFAMGMLVAVAMVVWGERRRPGGLLPYGLVAVGVAVIAGAFATRLDDPAVGNFFFPLSGVGCVGVMLGTMLAAPDSLWRRMLRRRLLLSAGAASYGAYLLHEPLLVHLGHAHLLTFKDYATWPLATLALVALSLVAGWYAYRLVELPGMRIGAILARREAAAPALVAEWRHPVSAALGEVVLSSVDGARVAPRELAGQDGLLVHMTPAPSDRARLAHLDVARADRLLGDVASWEYVARALGVGICAVTASDTEHARAAARRRGVGFPLLVDRDGHLTGFGGGGWRTEVGEHLAQPVTLVVAADGSVVGRVTGVERHMERVLEQVRARRAQPALTG